MLYTALSQGQKNVQTLQSLQTRIDLCMLHRKNPQTSPRFEKKKKRYRNKRWPNLSCSGLAKECLISRRRLALV